MFKTKDMFLMFRIIKKMEIKSELSEIVKSNKEPNENDLGMEVIGLVFENLEKVEKEVYELLASYFEKNSKDIEAQSMTETIEMIKKMFKDEDLTNFFKQAMKQ